MNSLRTVVLSVSLLVFVTEATWRYNEPPWEYNFKTEDARMKTNESVNSARMNLSIPLSWDPWLDSRCVEAVNDTHLKRPEPYDVLGVLGLNGTDELCSPPQSWNQAGTKYISVRLNGMGGQFCLQRGNSSRKYYYGRCGEMPEKSAAYRDGLDLRIPCRKAGDKMLWYRGNQSVSMFGNKCLYWSDVRSGTDGENFNFNSMFSPILLGRYENNDLHNHENYCRNPTKSPQGPWCFVRGQATMEPVAEMCFSECLRSKADDRLCLGKMLFPYTDYASYDLTDMLDLPQSYYSSDGYAVETEQIYSFGEDYRLRNLYQNRRISRNRCFQVGPKQGRERTADKHLHASTNKTALGGPWTYMPSDESTNEFGHHISSLFRPCFYACEDVNVECSPDPSFPYFGLKDETADGRKCLTYQRAAELLLSAGSYRDPKIFHTALFTNSYLEVSLANGTNTSIGNPFYDAAPWDFVSDKCLNIGYMFDVDPDELLHDHYNVFAGPGCFVEASEWGQPSAEFVPCFNTCKDSELEEAPKYRKNVSATERRTFSSMVKGIKHNFTLPLNEFKGLVDHVNPVSICLVAFVGTFSLFAVGVCMLIALHKI